MERKPNVSRLRPAKVSNYKSWLSCAKENSLSIWNLDQLKVNDHLPFRWNTLRNEHDQPTNQPTCRKSKLGWSWRCLHWVSLSLNGCGSRQVVVNWVFKLEWSVVLVAWTDGHNGQVGRRNYYYGFIYISWGNLICCFCIFFCVFVNIYIYYKGRFPVFHFHSLYNVTNHSLSDTFCPVVYLIHDLELWTVFVIICPFHCWFVLGKPQIFSLRNALWFFKIRNL